MSALLTILHDTYKVWKNEFKLVLTDYAALIFIVFLPLAYPLAYSLIYNTELVKDVPVVMVDDCRTPSSREYARMLDATEHVRVAGYAANMQEAKDLLNRKKVYGVIHLPKDFSRKVGRGEQGVVEAYCDMGVILRYKSIMTAVTTVGGKLGGKAQSGKLYQLENAPSSGLMPVPYRMVPVGNSSMGIASALIPGILVLILQQAFVLCIACVSATGRERKAANGGIDPLRVNADTLATLLGKTACYFMLMILPMIFLWRFVPLIFDFPQTGNVLDTLLLAGPFMLSVIFMAMGLQTLVRKREAVFPVLVVTSVFFLFLSGISWPRYAMNSFWTLVGGLIPSTWGVRAIWGISNMGATLTQQKESFFALWMLAGFFFLIAYFVLRFIDREKKYKE